MKSFEKDNKDVSVIYSVDDDFRENFPHMYIDEIVRDLNVYGFAERVSINVNMSDESDIDSALKNKSLVLIIGEDGGYRETLRECLIRNCVEREEEVKTVVYVRDEEIGKKISRSLPENANCSVKRYQDEAELAIRIFKEIADFAAPDARPYVESGKVCMHNSMVFAINLPDSVEPFRRLSKENFSEYGMLYASACIDKFGSLYFNEKYDLAEKFLEKGVEIYNKLCETAEGKRKEETEEVFADVCIKVAERFVRYDEYDDAEKYAKEALRLLANVYENDASLREKYVAAAKFCSDVCLHEGKRGEAVKYCIIAAEKAFEGCMEDAKMFCSLFAEVCIAADRTLNDRYDKDYALRKELLEKALAYENELLRQGREKDRINATELNVRLGEYHLYVSKDYSEAAKAYGKALKILNSNPYFKSLTPEEEITLRTGIALFRCGNTAKAELYLTDGLEKAELLCLSEQNSLHADMIAEGKACLAGVYAEQAYERKDEEKFRMAERLYFEAAREYEKLCGSFPDVYASLAEEVGKCAEIFYEKGIILFEKLGKSDKAEDCKRKLYALKNKKNA